MRIICERWTRDIDGIRGFDFGILWFKKDFPGFRRVFLRFVDGRVRLHTA
jgi:hypothetical protein